MIRYEASCDCGFTRAYSTEGRAWNGLGAHSCADYRTSHRRSCRRCGWAIVSRTAKLAERAKRDHSCEKQLAKRGAKLRREFRELHRDRTPKPCLHKETTHVHGTHACYVLDKCRCAPCTAANRRYETDRTRQQAYGRWNGLVDATAAREHVRALMTQGMGLKRIVEVSDVSQGLLWKLVYGKRRPDGSRVPSKRIRPDTESRILAVRLDLADGARIDSTATARRIQALVANGWSMSRIAERLGIERSNFTELAHGRREVTVATSKAMHALYSELVDVKPPETNQRERIAASRARRYARDLGWAPPLRIGGRAWIGTPYDVPTPDHDEEGDLEASA